MNRISNRNWRQALADRGPAPRDRAVSRIRPAWTVESPSNIECLEYLEMPDYPPLPRVASVQGIQTVKVLLLIGRPHKPSKAVYKTTTLASLTSRRRPFKESAEKALKNSDFRRPAAGRLSRWSFTTSCVRTITSPLFAFGPPNHFLGTGRTVSLYAGSLGQVNLGAGKREAGDAGNHERFADLSGGRNCGDYHRKQLRIGAAAIKFCSSLSMISRRIQFRLTNHTHRRHAVPPTDVLPSNPVPFFGHSRPGWRILPPRFRRSPRVD